MQPLKQPRRRSYASVRPPGSGPAMVSPFTSAHWRQQESVETNAHRRFTYDCQGQADHALLVSLGYPARARAGRVNVDLAFLLLLGRLEPVDGALEKVVAAFQVDAGEKGLPRALTLLHLTSITLEPLFTVQGLW